MEQIILYILGFIFVIIATPFLVAYALLFGGGCDSYFRTEVNDDFFTEITCGTYLMFCIFVWQENKIFI